MSAPDSSPTERWLQQLLEECEIQDPTSEACVDHSRRLSAATTAAIAM